MFTSRRGFTLIELLTVIAIMVILAAILLPVLGRAREQSNRTECMSNLHQIAVAMKLYRLDERDYPKDLTERPIDAGNVWFGPVDANGKPTKTTPGYGIAGLYPDYVESFRTFNCPDNEVDTTVFDSTKGWGDPSATAPADSYDAYDGFDKALSEIRYNRKWRLAPVTPLDPQYRRQLLWRYPPEDTVITWCSFHHQVNIQTDADYTPVAGSDKDIVLYLDGTTRVVPVWAGVGVPEEGSGHESTPGDQE